MKFFTLILLATILTPLSARAAEVKLTPAESVEWIKVVDERQRNSGDYKSECFVKETEKDKEPKIFQATVYRRDLDNKFMILFTRPKDEAGKGYLRIDKNLWFYDPNTGKWERRTEREKIGGTNSRRSDYDESRLAEEYSVNFLGGGKLGAYEVAKFKLQAKPEVDVAYPVIELWVDVAGRNVLKREEYALSGKLMRTTYYPKWNKKFSPSKKADVWVPSEMRVFDELEKGNSTIIVIKETDLSSLDANLFTKAWIEAKSK